MYDYDAEARGVLKNFNVAHGQGTGRSEGIAITFISPIFSTQLWCGNLHLELVVIQEERMKKTVEGAWLPKIKARYLSPIQLLSSFIAIYMG